MINLEPIALVYAGSVGVGLGALDSLSHAATRTYVRPALYAAFGVVLALWGLGDEALAIGVAHALARAVPQPAGSDNRAGMKLLAGLSVLFFALVGSGPFPWDDLRTWVWPVAALLVRAGLPLRPRDSVEAILTPGETDRRHA